ncbi:SusC/RagA family TonB-linked outer membrane protein [Empedobacter tilapiae]
MRRRLTSLSFLAFLGLGTMAFAQVTGVVNDGNNFPESDVEVSVKGTDKVAYTDENGNFNIDAQVGDTLVINGKEFKVTSSNLGTLKYSTEEKVDLGEVVVTGYGNVNRETFVGTGTEVDGKKLAQKSVSNVSQALAGEVAGVRVITNSGQPGSDATIRIRGFGSVNGNRSPLYVVDGAPFTGNISAINPEDIESLTVLKDATATAVYGARGANGVVVISTKKGSKKDAVVTIETKTSINSRLLPQYSTIKSPERYMELGWEALKNMRTLNAPGTDAVAWANANLFSNQGIGGQKYNMWNVANGGELIDPVTGKVRDGVTRKYNPENWEDYAFQTSKRSETNMSISGGSDKTTYYTSFGYLKDEGYIVNSEFEKYSTRLNITHKAKDWLTGSVDMGYAYSKSKNNGQTSDSGSIFWFTDNIPSIYPLFLRDANGNFVADPIFGGNQFDYGTGRGFGALTNSVADATYNKNYYNRHEMNVNAFLKADITSYLSFETRLAGQYFNNSRNMYNNAYYGSAASMGGSIDKTKTEMFSWNWLQMLRFNKRFGNHGVQAFVAHEYNSWSRDYIYAGKTGLFEDGGMDLNNGVITQPSSSYRYDYTLESFFGQLSYDYNNKYLFSATVRRDGTSRFLKDKWGTFWSVGAGWVASREEFLKGSEILPFLKFKASYGLTGDQALGGDVNGSYYPGYNAYQGGEFYGDGAAYLTGIGYPDLTWETAKQFQVGAEFALFKGKVIEATVDYYTKKTQDLIFDSRIAPSVGYTVWKMNSGELENKGIEFNVIAHVAKSKDFFLDFSVNGEILSNKLTEMPIDLATGERKVLDLSAAGFGRAKGHSIYDFYMREWAGVNSQTGAAQWVVHYVDKNGDGVFNTGDQAVTNLFDYMSKNPDAALSQGLTENYAQATQKFVGKSAIPDIRGGMNLSTGYKGFTLSVQMLYSLGGYAYDNVYAGLMRNGKVGGNNWHEDMYNRWQKPGDVTDVPRLSNNRAGDNQYNSMSTRFLTKTDYLSINNVRLGYDFPQQLLNRTGLSALNVFVSGDNLWLFSERKGFNPMVTETGNNSTYSYAPLSTFTLGLRVSF